MSIINLKKEVDIVLTKRKVVGIKARVGFAMDVTGSMEDEFREGLMDAVTNRFFALASRMDDNGEMDVWAFDTRITQLPTANMSNIEGYVPREIVNSSISKWGNTHYAPALRAAVEHYFPQARPETVSRGFFGFGKKTVTPGVSEEHARKMGSTPAILQFLTDGRLMDEPAAEAVLEQAARAGLPIYFNFVGIGSDNVEFFEWIERMGGIYPNVGFFSVPNIRATSDQALFEGLVPQELAHWLRTTSATAIA